MSTIANMTKTLTKTGTLLLTTAAQRDDQQIFRPDTMSSRSFARAVNTLLAGGFVSRTDRDENGPDGGEGGLGRLTITPAGLKMIGQHPEVPSEVTEEPGATIASSDDAGVEVRNATRSSVIASGRPGTKHAKVVALLSRADGATVTELLGMTGWLPHTLRGMLSGLRQQGFVVDRTRNAEVGTTYFIRDKEPERPLDDQNPDGVERQVA